MILPADERFALTTLRDMIANLQAHIDHRAAEIAAPLIEQAREAAAIEVDGARGMRQRAEDLNTELRRQLKALERQRDQLRSEVTRLRAGEAALPPAPHTTLTPAEWLRRFNDAPAEERLRVVEVLLGEVDRGSRCFHMDHEGVIEDLRAALTAARENQGSEIHGEPRTDPTPTRDIRPAP